MLWRCRCTYIYIHPICGGRTVAGRGGFLIAPPSALQFRRDLYTVNHCQSQQIVLTKQGPLLGDPEMVWKILRLCLQHMELYNMPQVTKKTMMYHYVQPKVVSKVLTRKISYFGICWSSAPCFWMHTSSVQIQKAPAAASPVNRVGKLTQ